MGIKTKILLPVITLILFIAAAILLSNIVLFAGFVDELTTEWIHSASKVAVNKLNDLKVEAATASLSISENEEVIDAITNNNRDDLLILARQLQNKTGMEFCTITDPEGTVILRTHAPENYGDSVASQANIQAAMTGKSLTAIEKGSVIRLAVRTGTPVYDHQGKVAGAVSVGFRLDTEQFVDLIKEQLACESTIFINDERISTTILKGDGTRALDTKADSHVSEMVLAGNAYTGQADILGRAAISRYTPIIGPADQVIGMLFVGQYVDEKAKTIQSFVQSGLIITCIMLVLAIIVILIIARRIVIPIQSMTKAASDLASGDIDIDIHVETKDEMRTLADAFNSMIENTRQQVQIIEHIANGNLAVSPQVRSGKDLMNSALGKLNQTIQTQAAAIREEHERIKLMLDATPLAIRLWSRDFRIIECNEATIKIFNLKNKQEYIDRYLDFSPEYQPDGQKTYEKFRILISEAFEKGECTYSWMYHMLDGTPIPSEVKLVRIPYGDDYVVASYSRDLREHNKMMDKIEYIGNLFKISNRTASILLSTSDDNNIEKSIMESFDLIGQGICVDRVQIWQNEIIDNALNFSLKYEWLSDIGRNKVPVPMGVHIPYSKVPGWESRFLNGEYINDPISILSQDEKNLLEPYDIKSMVIIPLVLENNQFWGFFSLDNCEHEYIFSDDEIEILKSIGLMFASALNRFAQIAKIREVHNRTKLLTNASPLGFNLWDRNHNNIETNDATVKLFALKDQQEYLKRFFEFSPYSQPDGRPSVEKAVELIDKAFEEGYCQFEWMHQKLDGTPIPAEITLVRVAYGDDYVVAGYMRDLREYQKMLREIQQRDNLLQTVNQAAFILLHSELVDFTNTLHQCMGMMACAVNADRMYLFKNHTENGKLYCTQLYEWSENVQPFQDTDVTSNVPYDEIVPETKKILARGECVHSLVRDMPASEQEQYNKQDILAILLVPVFMRNAFWGFVGFDNCHSEQLFTEQEESIVRSGCLLIANALLRNEYMLSIQDTSAKLKIALADAKHANDAKSNFLAHMSHEIRTPLNAVIGLSELALSEGELNREVASNLEKIYNAGSTILSIVNDILDISKIESGKFEIYPSQYDTPSLINDIVTLNIVRIGEKPVAFSLSVDEKLPGMLYGDDLRVKQIFNNLLSNAFKYTNAGTVEWRVSFEREGDDIWLISSVRDTGIGIKPEDMQKLFLDYNQVDVKTNRKVEGTGLGLAITKRLVEMMDGTITMESEYEKGTTFHVRLRQALVSDTPIGTEVAGNLTELHYTLSKRTRNTKLARVNLSYAHVLVVDDIATNLDVVKGMMKPYAMHIDCAASGRQAIEMIRAGKPRYSAVFMDHMMPGMDGVEATRIIREEIGTDYARNIPVIALTANAIIGNEEMFLSQGFQDFISKPIDIMKLDFVLRRWVRDKSREKELAYAGEDICLSDKNNCDAGNNGLLLQGITINGVDMTKGLERFGGNETAFIDVLRSYAANTRPLLSSLRECLAAENFEDYAIAIHGIKGSSYGIFALEAGKAAETLEIDAKMKNFDAIRNGHSAFEKIMEALLDHIDKGLSEIDAATGKPAAAVPDPVLLKELREACEAFDMDRVDKAMARLESFRYENGGQLVAWLREQVSNMAFEEIFSGKWPSE